MFKTLIKKAKMQALKSELRAKHGAIIFKSGRIISESFNQVRGYKKIKPEFRKWHNSLHAEQAAVLRAKRDLKGCSMLVLRIDSSNVIKMSKPCDCCSNYIKYVGISKVFYSTEDGVIEEMRL